MERNIEIGTIINIIIIMGREITGFMYPVPPHMKGIKWKLILKQLLIIR